jgi:hypothetical protein
MIGHKILYGIIWEHLIPHENITDMTWDGVVDYD